eukprot:6614734-Alexandrium_andersonii.AAC.1
MCIRDRPWTIAVRATSRDSDWVRARRPERRGCEASRIQRPKHEQGGARFGRLGLRRLRFRRSIRFDRYPVA